MDSNTNSNNISSNHINGNYANNDHINNNNTNSNHINSNNTICNGINNNDHKQNNQDLASNHSSDVNSTSQIEQQHIRSVGECTHDNTRLYVGNREDVCDIAGAGSDIHRAVENDGDLALHCQGCNAIICQNCYVDYELEEGRGSNDLLDQFNITNIINIDLLNNFHISLTNLGLYLTIASFILLNFNILSNNFYKLIYNG
jgi:hypothetical protein